MRMIEVSRDEFFEFLKNDPRDIMPTSNRNETVWRTRDFQVVAITYPGYLHPGNLKSYTIAEKELKR